MKGTSILIVEDDPRIAEMVAKNLEAAGYACHVEHHGQRGWEAFRDKEPSLAVLDVMLPGMDGLEITRRIRKAGDTPILLLTARSGEGDTVLGFEVGADDYLTKPFSPRELVARVRALLRRASGALRDEVLSRGELEVDLARREARRAGRTIELTTLEFDVLHMLASRPGRVFSREALLDQVWGDERVVDPRTIDSLMSRLRKKLEPDPAHPIYIQTVWGAGYRFPETG